MSLTVAPPLPEQRPPTEVEEIAPRRRDRDPEGYPENMKAPLVRLLDRRPDLRTTMRLMPLAPTVEQHILWNA